MLEPLEKSGWTPAAAAHLLSRAGFGGSPSEVRALHAEGLDRAVDSLLEVPDESDLFPPPSASIPQDLAELRAQAAGKSEEEKKALQVQIRKAELPKGISFSKPEQFRFASENSADPAAAEEFFRSMNEQSMESNDGGSIGMLQGPAGGGGGAPWISFAGQLSMRR